MQSLLNRTDLLLSYVDKNVDCITDFLWFYYLPECSCKMYAYSIGNSPLTNTCDLEQWFSNWGATRWSQRGHKGIQLFFKSILPTCKLGSSTFELWCTQKFNINKLDKLYTAHSAETSQNQDIHLCFASHMLIKPKTT